MSKLRGRPFQRGNKFGRGRPRGSKNKISPDVGKLLKEHSEAVWRKIILSALQGNPQAQRLYVQYIPPLERPAIGIVVPDQPSPRGLAEILDRVLHEVVNGNVSAEEGKKIADIVERRRHVFETVELDERMSSAEELTERAAEMQR